MNIEQATEKGGGSAGGWGGVGVLPVLGKGGGYGAPLVSLVSGQRTVKEVPPPSKKRRLKGPLVQGT